MKKHILLLTTLVAGATGLFAQPAITQPPLDQTVANGSNVTFNVTASETGTLTYQWLFNGTNIGPLINTVAGNGTSGFSGDGGAATSANLGTVYGVAMDKAGNLFMADYSNNRIRKMDTNGIITTVAGNGTIGFSGDGGAATNATMQNPYGVAMDGAGNLFIADYYNYRIRKVDTNGIITTVAGNGTYGFSGDGGAATNASMAYPEGVVVDNAGNLFIADYYNSRIRKVDTNGIITSVAGNGTIGFSGDGGAATNASMDYPDGVAVDGAGNLFIADYYNSRIRKVDTNGIITTVAGNGTSGFSGDGGAATNANIYNPYGVAVDGAGNLFIADYYNSRIRKVDTNGVITTVAGNGTYGFSGDGNLAGNAAMRYPSAVTVGNAGDLFVADYANWRVRKVYAWPATNAYLTFANITTNNIGSYSVIVSDATGSVTSSVAALNMPAYIATQPASQTVILGGSGTLAPVAGGSLPLNYQWSFNGTNLPNGTNAGLGIANAALADGGNYVLTVTNLYGTAISSTATVTVAYISQQPANFTVAGGGTAGFNVQMSGGGPFTYQWQFNGVNLPTNGVIRTVAGNGSLTFSGNGGPATNAALNNPHGSAMDSAGNLYVADYQNNRVRKVSPGSIITTYAGSGSYGFAGDGGAATNAAMEYPAAVALDKAGNLYVADINNHRIRKIGTNGVITTFAGNGTAGFGGDGNQATGAALYFPSGLAVDSAGNLLVADANNNRVRKVSTNGTITTVAGTGTAGFAGDGSLATSANLNHPAALAVDAFGNIFVADYNNQRVRKVDANGFISTIAGRGASGFSGDGGAATNAYLYSPDGVAVDSAGNVFIADYQNYRVREVYPNGIITTVAGNGSLITSDWNGSPTGGSIYYARGVSVDAANNIYIADNYRIRKIAGNPLYPPTQPTLTLAGLFATNAGNYTVVVRNASGSITSSVASLTVQVPPMITSQPASQMVGVGRNAAFSAGVAGSGPFGYLLYYGGTNLVQSGTNGLLTLANVSTNNSGDYLVVVTNNYGSVTSQVATLTVVLPPAITGPPFSQTYVYGSTATFNVAATGVGPLFYQWVFNGTNLPAIITTVAGNGTNGSVTDNVAATNSLIYPWGVGCDKNGNVYIADRDDNRVRKVGANGIITTVAGKGVASSTGDGGQATNASINWPEGVAFDVSGNMFITERAGGRVRKVDTNGIITTALSTAAFSLFGIFSDSFGNVYAPDSSSGTVRKIAPNGAVTSIGAGGSGYSAGACDAAGNVYVADAGNNRVRKIDANGITTTIAGNGVPGFSGDGGPATNATLNSPWGLAMDWKGRIFISERYNQRIRMVDTNGIITTVAGNGIITYTGDGGPATQASFHSAGISVDPAGNLYIADDSLQYVRKVHFAGDPALVLANVGTANVGNYSVIVSSPYGSVTSSIVSLSIPPYFTLQPQSQSAPFGGMAAYSVAAGGSPPLNYQWYFLNPALQTPAGATALTYYGFTVAALVTNNGLGYTTVPGVQVVGGGGMGASGYATVSNGMVTAITMTNAGYSYFSQPAIQIDPPNGLLPNQTNPALSLNAVSAANAGNYYVIVTNNYGAVTSSLASLVLFLTPQNFTAGKVAGNPDQLLLQLNGTANYPYVLQSATNLTSPVNWQTVLTNPADGSGNWQFTDTNLNGNQKFYRAIGQ